MNFKNVHTLTNITLSKEQPEASTDPQYLILYYILKATAL